MLINSKFTLFRTFFEYQEKLFLKKDITLFFKVLEKYGRWNNSSGVLF